MYCLIPSHSTLPSPSHSTEPFSFEGMPTSVLPFVSVLPFRFPSDIDQFTEANPQCSLSPAALSPSHSLRQLAVIPQKS